MIKKLLFLNLCLLPVLALRAQTINPQFSGTSIAQPQPFLFTLNTLNPAARGWSLNYSGGYGQRTVTPLGYDGVDQNLSVKGYLGNQFTLVASMGVGFGNNGRINSLQQAEVLRDFIGGNSVEGVRVGASLGFRREFNSDKVALSRIAAAFENLKWKLGANVRFEKAFDKNRDNLDVISSIGIHRQISGQLFGGLEAIGQDIEGFWQTDEAEGGARVLIGPSLNYTPPASRFSFTLCGGPIIYATRSVTTLNEFAVRDLPSNNGFTMKFNVGFRL
ncbi:hypothetical protein [Mucilaginibacter xinganensis]|uniref:Outer membrane protein beta-barrel domain-containing protein n=1 Tax=Mucilaginibacter xinganensis TaxID=1234841 RepID=A0A223P0A1_9SPHI|nr:hypothetical protein [Mucilaginibacter xinganensis]ASU35542.1 hypothetical protein MuYL_3657 [Mucilaginibacter xinganensis]